MRRKLSCSNNEKKPGEKHSYTLLILMWSVCKIITDTVFENHPKSRILNFSIMAFPAIFVLLKLTCLVTLFDRKLQVFKISPKLTLFGIFNELLSTQNVNVARFARNVECDFFRDFQTLCIYLTTLHL